MSRNDVVFTPNCCFSFTYLMTLSYTPIAMPHASQPTYILECSKTFDVERNQQLVLLWMNTLLTFKCMFCTVFNAGLLLITPAFRYALLIGTIKYSTFLLSLFLAHTDTISLLALPIHLLVPFNLYPPSTLITLAVILLASEPMFSSVRPPSRSTLQLSYQLNR